MKTQEEIEQLAESQYGTEIGSIRGSNPYDLEGDRKNGYIKGYTQCQEDNNKEQDWTNFEGELMDWAHQLGQEQKYTPYPAQFLEWLKNNYKIPQKK